MGTELARAIDRLVQSGAALRRDLEAAKRRAPTAERRIGLEVTPGARVFDTVTGQEAEVVHGTRENVVLPTPERDQR